MSPRPVTPRAIVKRYVDRVRALPERERAIYVAIVFLNSDAAEVAGVHGLTVDEMVDVVEAAVRRVEPATKEGK